MAIATTIKFGNNLVVTDEGSGVIRVDWAGAIGGGGLSAEYIDFEAEYGDGSIRSFDTGNEDDVKTAFTNLGNDLRGFTTRDKLRKVWFGPANGKAYWLNQNVPLESFEDVIFKFDTGPEFSGSVASFAPMGCHFMWSGAEDVPMFSIIATDSTVQRGMWWEGSWTFGTATDGYGYALFIDGVNNWGGPKSAVSLFSQGNTKVLKRGIVTDNQINYDNAHGMIGAIYSGGCKEGAIHAIGGGFNAIAGNISTSTGQTGVYVGPNGSEVKCGPSLKIDGGGDFGVDCYGANCRFDGQFEGFAGGTAVRISRDPSAYNSGRRNRLGMNIVGNDGTVIPWIITNPADDGSMWGNILNMPTYSNCADPSKASDSVMLPEGVGVLGAGMDEYRLIQNGAYVTTT